MDVLRRDLSAQYLSRMIERKYVACSETAQMLSKLYEHEARLAYFHIVRLTAVSWRHSLHYKYAKFRAMCTAEVTE
jgi:hypothetical protein